MFFEIENYQSLKSSVEELCDFLSSHNVRQERVFDSKLALYELLGNVLKHSDGKARVYGELAQGFVELKIFSEKTFTPPQKSICAEVFSEHGRGLFLVDHVCDERGCTKDGGIYIRIKVE